MIEYEESIKYNIDWIDFYFLVFKPGACVVDDKLVFVGIVPRFDASVHVT